jgi:hypothetical protein
VRAYLDDAPQAIEIFDDILNSKVNSIEQRYEVTQVLE